VANSGEIGLLFKLESWKAYLDPGGDNKLIEELLTKPGSGELDEMDALFWLECDDRASLAL
jgi:hypothetical protein